MSPGKGHRRAWSDWSRRVRYALVVGSVLMLLGVAWAVLARSGAEGTSDTAGSGRSAATGGGAAGTQGMGGMAGMERMATSGDSAVRVTADHIRQFGITFGTVEERPLERTVRTVGLVSFDETRLAQVSPKVSGFVERLYVDFTGQPVRRGQPLLELYSPELVAAQEELLLAGRLERDLGSGDVPGVPAGTTDLVGSAKRRLRLWDISQAQIEEILRTGEVRRSLTLHSPASGVVIEKNVQRGQAVDAGRTLYRIADLSEVWVEAELREEDAGAVRVGTSATVELAAFPGREVQGRVEYVHPTLQEEARTLRARIALPNPDGRIKPGMYATVRLATPIRRALTVPASAVVQTGERAIAFVDMGGGRLMPHELELGPITESYAEVLGGLEPGQRVVTSAQFLLESESNLGEVMRAMMGQMGLSDMSPLGDMEGMDMKGADPKGMTAPRAR